MGYSGVHIMNGDLCMDLQDAIMSKIGLKQKKDYSGWVKPRSGGSIAQRLSNAQDDLLVMCEKKGKQLSRSGERYIPTLVLGVTLIQHGAVINPKVMKAIVTACDKDKWGEGNLERKIYLNDFKNILASYDHKTPTDECRDRKKEFGVGFEEFCKRNYSGNVANMALHHIREEFQEKKWYAGSELVFGAKGYHVLIDVRFNDKLTPKLAMSYLNELFEVPILFRDVDGYMNQKEKETCIASEQ